MQPAVIACENHRSGATPCAEQALVRSIRYEYKTQLFRSTGHELLATHYEIECPKCGKRKKVVVAPPD